jgi:hypothetical protein
MMPLNQQAGGINVEATFTAIAIAFVLAFHIIPAVLHHRALNRRSKEA